MPCRLSPQWICGNSCPWAHDVQLHIAGTKALCMLWITYDHLCYVLCFACWALFGSLGPALCNVHCVLNCMSGHKTIVAITGRAHCFHDCIYITSILLLWDLSNLCRGPLMTIYIYIYDYNKLAISTKH